jgi:hypothetical protein
MAGYSYHKNIDRHRQQLNAAVAVIVPEHDAQHVLTYFRCSSSYHEGRHGGEEKAGLQKEIPLVCPAFFISITGQGGNAYAYVNYGGSSVEIKGA